ncbi:hypothetical protein KY285_029078 [Solanum tuberosum]|nr:hypothetical protein KY285_029078 [Solanum tuberosum]
METKFNLLERNYDGGAIESDGGLMIFCQPGKALKGGKPHLLDLKEMEQAHIYILNIVMKFNHFSSDSSQKKSDRQFISWFKEKIEGLYEHDDSKKMADLLTLSRGPMKNVTKFKGYIINGYRFHVQDYNNGLRTQNCGIVVSGEAGEEGRIIDYYGELTEILELQFVGGRRLVLFRCMWFDVYDNERGVKMDEYDFDDMNPSIFKKSEMGSSSKNFKQSFLPPGALARGRGKSLKSIGSVRVTAEKRNLIDQTEITLETLRSKSKKEIGHNFTYGGSVKGSIVRGSIEKRIMKTNVVPPGFDALKDETSFPNDDLEVMQQTMRSKPAKENGQNITFVCSVKGSIVRGSVEKRTMVGNSKDEKSFPNDDLEVTQQTMRSKPAKENGHNSTYVCSVKESIVRGSVEKRTMVGNSKDEKSFPNDDLEVTQQTMRSKPGSNVVQRTSIGKRKIYCVPSSDKNELAHNKNLMQPGFDPIEVDTFFPSDDLENAIPQKSNVVCPDFDAIEVETSFPHDDHEVMKENMRSKPGKENGKNITSVGSARGSTFVQRTSIGKSKGYSVVSSDMNVRAYNKILRQPDFNPIEHVTSFPHDDLEAMPEALRSKSARERAQSFTYVGSPRRCAEKRTLNGKNKKSKNTEYDLNELTKNNNRVPLGLDPMEDDLTLPQDEVEVMQETRRKHLGSLVRDRNMCPLRVHSWTDIEEAKLEHMWGAITEKFDSDDMIGHRDHVLKHMRRLWNNWKGSLHMNVKSKPLREVLKDVPEGVDKSDWEWLVKEHFLSKKFKMQAFLEAYELWETVTEDKPVAALLANPTLAQIKSNNEEKAKKSKAKSLMQNAVENSVFYRIMACKTAKEAWDRLKEEYQGNDRTRQMQVLNLKREFECLNMQDDETISKYADRISLIVNNLVDRPRNRKVIGVKWIFKTKLNPDGTICKHKARLVVKGYAQQYGVDYQETFAPAARYDTIKLILAFASHSSWQIHQLDVKSAFLNGLLAEEIYVEQPDGFSIPGKEDQVYLLTKALYGLKQDPRAWYERMDNHLIQLGFSRSQSEATLYVKVTAGESLIVSIYVDDMLVTGSKIELIQRFKDEMEKIFEMTDLGAMKYFLGMEVLQYSDGIFICQQKYISDILNRFKMQDCKPVSTPITTGVKLGKDEDSEKVDDSMYRSLIGSLLYLTASRPAILFVVSLLSRFMHSPKDTHFTAAKRVLSSRKQETTAQSTAEAEYIAAASAVNQAIWLGKMLKDLGHEQTEATKIMCDNSSAVSISKNPVFHGRTKHNKIKFHFIREVQQSNEVLLVHCSSENQLADIFTKSLPKERFEDLRQRIGVCHKNAKEEC